MRRPISIAMSLSVMIHFMLFMVADWLLDDKADPSLSDTVLLVRIRPPPAETGYSADETQAAPAANSEPGIPETNGEAAEAANPRSRNLHASETAGAAEIRRGEATTAVAVTLEENHAVAAAEQGVDESHRAAAGKDRVLAPFDVATTIRPAAPVVSARASKTVRPAPVQAPLSSRQEKMLRRKITAWMEKSGKAPEGAADLSWRHKGQEYLAKFLQLPAGDEMGMQRVIVEVSTEEDGKRLSTRLRMKRLAFSSYAQLVDRWDPDVQIHNDELDGRFHSNSEINLTYSRKVKPRFYGKVTTTARRINITESHGHVGRDQIFSGGLQTGARAIRLPKHFLPFPDEAGMSDDQLHHFEQDTRITFHADGSYEWQVIGADAQKQLAVIAKDTTYLIAARKVKLHVRGTVNGKVLVYSPERIVIDGNLVYEQDPEEVPDADDYLGLVSDKYVDIAPPDVTGPGDLVINAAIYARRRFAVKSYRTRNDAKLYVYGSLSAGSLSATEPRYYTRVRFDHRLEERRPPGFPMTDRFEVESWDPAWSVEATGL